MNLGAFTAVTLLGRDLGSDQIRDYAGLVQRRPTLTLLLSLFLLSLAGIPITAGFFAKFFLFQSVAAVGTQYLWVVIVALLASTAGLYYYLNIIRQMVICEPSEAVLMLQPAKWEITSNGLALTFCLVGTMVLGIWSAPSLRLFNQAASSLLAGANYGVFISQQPNR
jgi:NADH:ubiquinone oxidoreductase subunit 2 (subunit N)